MDLATPEHGEEKGGGNFMEERPRKILIVENELIFAHDLRQKLERYGFQVTGMADRSETAVSAALQNAPDLILMDIRLRGDVDGITTAERIRAELDVPVIFLTAYADDATLARARATGPFGYVLKPVEDRALLAAITMALNRHDMESRIREGEAWFSGALRSIGDAVLTLDPEEKIRTLNVRGEALLGMAEREVQGMTLSEVLRVVQPLMGSSNPLDNLKDLRAPFREAERLALGMRNDTTVWVHLYAAPILTGGYRVGTVLVLHDLTESDTMQQRLLEREQDLQKNYFLLHESFRNTIRTMANIVEVRDSYTAGHQRRVADLSRALADRLGLGEMRSEGVYMASLVHDIGKIHVPSEILSKPGRLSELEYAFIQTHPAVGAEVLKTVPFPWPLQEVIRQHHERMDGSGYPQKLRGEEILMEARILCVADVVEAMQSHRPYRPALGQDVALNEIRKRSGQAFDENVVEACLELFREGFTFSEE